MRNTARLSALVLATFAFACNNSDKDGDTDDSDDSGTDSGTSCVGLASSDPTIPAAGDTAFFYRGQMTVKFQADANAVGTTFALADAGGTAVNLTTAEWSADGKTAFFGPATPLSPSTSYTLSIQTDCSEAADIAFTTSALGAAVTDTAGLEGSTYELDLASADIVKPPGVGGLLGTLLGQLGDTAILFEVKAVDTMSTPNTIDLFGGIGDKAQDGTITQDACTPTFGLGSTTGDAAEFDNPYFELNAPNGITIAAAGVSITLDAVLLSGAFEADGSSIGGARLAGQADARKLAPALGDLLSDISDADSLCTLISSFGVACEPCDGDGQAYCLTIDAQNITADVVDQAGFDFVEISDSDLDSDCE